MSNEVVPPAQVQWAQRENLLYITIVLEDCKNPTINLTEEKLCFKGVGGSEKKAHEVTLNFYQNVKPEESRHVIRDRTIDFVVIKKEDKWWPRLINDTKKYHWLKVDFNKWKDEDESGEENDMNFPYEDMMRNDKLSNFDLGDGNGSDESDDLDEELPDLVADDENGKNEKNEKNENNENNENNEKKEKNEKDEDQK